MRNLLVYVILSLGIAVNANATPISVKASPKNIGECVSGNPVWEKVWDVAVTDATATITGKAGSSITLKKSPDNTYAGTLAYGVTTTFFVLRVIGNLYKLEIRNKSLGCLWEGSQ
jgi:hypothetical protein